LVVKTPLAFVVGVFVPQAVVLQVTVTVAPTTTAAVAPFFTVPVIVTLPAATYGPTMGPPLGAPVGVTPSVDVSPTARARFRRPFPAPPVAGSVLRASRPTIAAFDALGSTARNNAAAPAVTAADADVPVTEVVPAASEAVMFTPGAPMSTAALVLLPDHTASD
jgi:hypothetical protein